MISICIPIYNFNVTALVQELDRQSKLQEKPIELVLIDDASQSDFKVQNITECSKHNYIQLPENIGRAAIRNLFLKYAQYQYLLFLDCDSAVKNPAFLKSYLTAIKENPQAVICGGRIYPTAPPSKEYKLRYKYGVEKESKAASERSKKPHSSFMTNNFVVSRAIFNTIAFDERLKNYGHEDTLFGFELKQKGIDVIHIENPIINDHLETNPEYIANTENAIVNLIHILAYTDYNKTLIDDITLLRTYYNFKWLKPLLLLGFILFNGRIKRQLSQGKVNLTAFDFYKLGFLAKHLNH